MDHVEVLQSLVTKWRNHYKSERQYGEYGEFGARGFVSCADELQAVIAALSAKPEGEAVAPDGWVLVRREAIDWLNGESDFECPPDRYFRGKPPRYWWRSVFREKAGLDEAALAVNATPCSPGIRVDAPLDVFDGPNGAWYCEKHPEQLQDHDGCDGAGIPARARIPMLLHQIRQLHQRLREQEFAYGYLADLALDESPRSHRVVVDEAMKRRAMNAQFQGISMRDALASGTDWNDEVLHAALVAALGEGE